MGWVIISAIAVIWPQFEIHIISSPDTAIVFLRSKTFTFLMRDQSKLYYKPAADLF